jgi:cell division protein FtsQ
LSDPEDVQALLAEGNAAITLHFGDANFFDKYQMYQTHLAEWQQQYPRLAKVDLRNAPQVVLGMGDAAAAAASAAKAPVSAAPSAPLPDATATAPQESAAVTPPVANPVPAPAVAKPTPNPAAGVVKTTAGTSKGKVVTAAKTSGGKHAAAKPAVTAAKKPAAPSAAPTANASVATPATRRATDTAALDTFRNETPQTPATAPHPRLVMRVQMPAATATPPNRTPTGVQP